MAFFPLPASPCHSLSSCSSTVHLQWTVTSPYRTLLFWLHYSSKRVCRDLSVKICLINTCPQSFVSTGTFSSWHSLTSVRIFPRSSAEATSVLQYLPEHEASLFTHLGKQLQHFNPVSYNRVKLLWIFLNSQWSSGLALCLEYSPNID